MFSTAPLVFALIWGSTGATPGSVVSRSADAILLERAAAALRRGDRAEVEVLLRGWATLAAEGDLPRGLESQAAAAQNWAEGHGRFQLFASRLADRVRVGVNDPAALLGRVDAFAIVDGRRIQIAQTEGGESGRIEYRVADQQATVIVEAVMTRFGAGAVLTRVQLLPAAESKLPTAPDRNAFNKRTSLTLASEPPKDEPVPWWLLTAAVFAATLAGAAIWQETRF